MEIGQAELEDNEDELIRIMHDRFMMGEDAQWIDYKQIDENEGLDDRVTLERDQEEEWFDKDEPNAEKQDQQSIYTGVLDY